MNERHSLGVTGNTPKLLAPLGVCTQVRRDRCPKAVSEDRLLSACLVIDLGNMRQHTV